MSFKNLGAIYTCDVCDKVVHSPNGVPVTWTKIHAASEQTLKYGDTIKFHACEDCWPHPKPEMRKTMLKRIRDAFRKTPNPSEEK